MWDRLPINIALKLNEIAELLGTWFSEHLINIIAILFGAWLTRHFGIRLFGGLLKHTVRADLYPTRADREKRIKTLNTLVGAFLRVGVYIIAAILIIGEVNPTYTTALFTSAGLIGAALGFGAKDIINDFVSGIFIIIENQYRVGDIIEAGGVSGVVEDVTIRTTVLRGIDGDVHHVRNGSIGVTTNKTLDYSQVNENIVVGNDTDLTLLEHIITHIGEQMMGQIAFQNKLIEPPHLERIVSVTENGIIIKILAKTPPGDQWQVKSGIYKRLLTECEKHNIKMFSAQTLPQPGKSE